MSKLTDSFDPAGGDPNRPDGAEERLVRIETRMVKYQQANTLVLAEITNTLARMATMEARIIEVLQEAIENEQA